MESEIDNMSHYQGTFPTKSHLKKFILGMEQSEDATMGGINNPEYDDDFFETGELNFRDK